MTERPRARTSSGHAASAPPAPASDPAETGDWSPFPSLDRARAGASAGSAQTPLPPPPTEPLAAAPTTAAAQVATLPQAPIAAPVPAPAVPGLRYYWYAHPFWRAVAIVAALAAAGVLVWLLVLRGDSTPTVQPAGSPAILTPSELATFSDQIGQPIYWVGPAAGA